MRRLPILALPFVAAALLTGGSGAVGSTPFCTGHALGGRFQAVVGSQGAGNIVYALTLTNRAKATCAISGLPNVTLLGRYGKALPTNPRAASPNKLTAVLVRLTHGHSTRATARFSPDVPGVGEPATRACEPTAYKLAVKAPGGGRVVVPVTPPTPVCEHGQLQLSAYQPAH